MRHVLQLTTVLLVASSSIVAAQRPDSVLPRARAGGARAAGGQLDAPTPQQQVLAREIRRTFSTVVRRQLGLSDEQAKKLNDVDTRYQRQRTEVGRDERAARLALRTALEDSTAKPDDAKIDEYLGRLVKAQHRRADLLEAEQKDLSGFLSPVQRAKYLGLREQLTRRISQLRQDAPVAGRRGARPPR
jgi:hypothetical protein